MNPLWEKQGWRGKEVAAMELLWISPSHKFW
jgi:hypothetical protein